MQFNLLKTIVNSAELNSVELLAKKVLKENCDSLTDRDYDHWLNKVIEVGQQEETQFDNKDKFFDVVFDILDNDSKVDTIETDDVEQLKGNIANLLWDRYSKLPNKTKPIAISERFDSSKFEIAPSDYSKWLNVIVDIAVDHKVSINRKNKFFDIALSYVLDNDPKIESLGVDDKEQLKLKIADTLWKTFKASKAHDQVATGVKSAIAQAQEEEQVFSQLDKQDDPNERLHPGRHVEINLQGKWHPCMVVSHQLNNRYIVRLRLHGKTHDISVAREQLRQERNVEDEQQSQCPYPHGSLRAALWHDYNKRDAYRSNVKYRTEEEQQVINIEDFDPSAIDNTNNNIDNVDIDDNIDNDQKMSNSEQIANSILADFDLEDGDDTDGSDQEIDQLVDKVADLEQRLAQIEDNGDHSDQSTGDPNTELDIDYDSLGNDRGGAASVIGVSTPARSSETEDEQNIFRRAITSPRAQLTQAVKGVEQEGEKAWRMLKLPKNPHPKDTQAYRAWDKGMKAAAKNSLGLQPKVEPFNNKKKKKQ